MEIADWRKKIDSLDEQIVALLSERAAAAVAIGEIKRGHSAPIYEPDRERIVFEHVRAANPGVPATIDPLGRSVARLGLGLEGVLAPACRWWSRLQLARE